MRITLIVSSVLMASALVTAGCSDDGGGGSSPFEGGDSDDVGDGDDGGGIDLGDLTEGDLEDANDLVEGLVEGSEDLVEGLIDQFSGEGAGTVEFNGESIDFEAEFCFQFDADFEIEGPGTAADGTPVWVQISHTEQIRAEFLEFASEEAIQLIYGDADPLIDDYFSLAYGREELFGDGAAEGLPDIYADRSSFDMEINGGSATGSGTATDFNGVLAGFGESLPFSFQVSCS